MANMVKKLCGIAGVLTILLVAAAALPSRAGATLWPNLIHGTHSNPGGLGGALIYPLFTVEGGTGTLLAITNTTITFTGNDSVVAALCPGADGCPTDETFQLNSRGTYTLVHFHARKTTDSSDLKNWTVCLSPGDVWTAEFSNVGGNTQISTLDSSVTSVAFPLTISGQTKGYIEAVAVDSGTSQQYGCDGQVQNPAGNNGDRGFDFNNSLFGEAFFVSQGSGLSNGYNATALRVFQDIGGDGSVLVVNSIKSTLIPDTGINTAQKRSFFALTHPALYSTVGSLASRWILDSSIGLDTQMVVTFPVGNVTLKPVGDFGFGGFDNCSNCTHFNFNIPATMALWLWNDEEVVDGQSPRQVTMGNEVNILTLSSLISAGTVHLPTVSDTGGWLRLMNDDDENQFVDAVLGKTCSVTSPGDTCINAGGTLDVRFVPEMLPVVGFSILTAPPQFNALLPWKFQAPASTYDCYADASGDFGQCTGVDLDPTD